MTDADLDLSIGRYHSGLETEIALLRQLQLLSTRQRQAAAGHDPEGVAALVAERERLMSALVELEHGLKPVRDTLVRARQRAIGRSTFQRVVRLHRAAEELVSAILACDQETLRGLREAEAVRRLASHIVETGENMLAAYRRVVAPPAGSAGLVNRRG